MKTCSQKDWDINAQNLNPDRIKINVKLIKAINNLRSSGDILEIGAQSGIDAEYLSDKEYNITALDYSRESIQLMKKRRLTKIVRGDALKLPFPDNSFDLTYSQGLIEHFRQPELSKIIQEQKRVVKENGHIIIDVPNTFSLNTIPKQILIKLNKWIVPWETQYTSKQLKKIGIENGLEFHSIYSWGYDKYIGERIRNKLTFMEEKIQKFENYAGHYFMKCIGAIFRKSSLKTF